MDGQSSDADFTKFLLLLETSNLEHWNNADIKEFANYFKLPTPEAETILDFFNRLHGKWNKSHDKCQAKKISKKILSEAIPKLVKKFGPKWLINKVQAASDPLGHNADGQLMLELAGYNTAGSWMRLVGSCVACAILGFAIIRGLPGALVGGVLGLDVWYASEKANFYLIERV